MPQLNYNPFIKLGCPRCPRPNQSDTMAAKDLNAQAAVCTRKLAHSL